MLKYSVLLILAVCGMSAAVHPMQQRAVRFTVSAPPPAETAVTADIESTELESCQARYVFASASINHLYRDLTAEQRAKVEPVRRSVDHALTFIRGRDGEAGGDGPLCADNVLDTLANVVARIRSMTPPPRPLVEGRAERDAFLKAGRAFLSN